MAGGSGATFLKSARGGRSNSGEGLKGKIGTASEGGEGPPVKNSAGSGVVAHAGNPSTKEV